MKKKYRVSIGIAASNQEDQISHTFEVETENPYGVFEDIKNKEWVHFSGNGEEYQDFHFIRASAITNINFYEVPLHEKS